MPGKPGAAAEIGQARRAPPADAPTSCAQSRKWRRQGSASVAGADQIDRPLPAAQQIEIDAQPLQCFT